MQARRTGCRRAFRGALVSLAGFLIAAAWLPSMAFAASVFTPYPANHATLVGPPVFVGAEVLNASALDVRDAAIKLDSGAFVPAVVLKQGEVSGSWTSSFIMLPNGTEIIHWTWNPVAGGANPDQASVYVLPQPLAVGDHTVTVRINRETSTWSFRVSPDRPSITAVSPTPGSRIAADAATVSVTFSAPAGLSAVTINGAAASVSGNVATRRLTGLAGTTAVTASVGDMAGNTTSASWSFTADTAPSSESTCTGCHVRYDTKPGMTGNCASCHAGNTAPAHGEDGNAAHESIPVGASAECVVCHGRDLPAIHKDCACHTLGQATSAKMCIDCHTSLTADHAIAHETQIATQVLAGSGGAVCGDCHDANLMREHAKPTAISASAGCTACHPSPRNTVVSLSVTSCAQAGCHVPASPDAQHGAMAAKHALPAPAPSCIAADCHAGTDLATVHSAASTTTAGVTRRGCLLCHSGTSQPTSGACAACHGADPHGDLTTKHTAVTQGSVACTGCHGPTADVRTIHDGRAEGRCAVCHANPTKGNLAAAQASAECSGCHLKTPIETNHYPAATHAGSDGPDCSSCHSLDLAAEHAKATSGSITCVGCHSSAKFSAMTRPWNGSCSACHGAGHAAAAAAHTPLSANAGCFSGDCHTGNDVSVLHSAATTMVAGVPRTGCLVCHARTLPSDVSCANCHPEKTGSHADPTLHTSSVTCLESCHTTRLDTEHANRGLGCAACHKSADVNVKHAISNHLTACSACHGADHTTSASFCGASCHAGSSGTYAGSATYATQKHSSVTTSTRALVTYPGTTKPAGACGNCHNSHSSTRRASGNALCFACHDGAGTTKPSTYSYQGTAGYNASAHGVSSSAQPCGACHAVHGASDASGTIPSGLTKRDPNACTGTQAQPGCHASGTNAKNGTNILAAFNAGASAGSHHDVFNTSGTHIDCSSCHNPHKDTGTTEYANPASTGATLTGGFDRFRDATGKVYALVGAKHDAIGPVISNVTTSAPIASDPSRITVSWYTNENAAGYVDYGPTTAYGSTANAVYASYTFNYVYALSLPMGTTWHYRIRAVDPIGNSSASGDYTFRLPWTGIISAPAVSGGTGGTPVSVTWQTRGACSSWVDYGPTTAYGSTAGSALDTTAHTVQLPAGLAPGVYHLRARSNRDVDSYASPDMVVTVYPAAFTAPVLTTVPNNDNIPGAIPIGFSWTQPNTTYAPFTYQLHVWDPNSSPNFDYLSPWLTTNTATVSLDGDHNYQWTVQAKDKNGSLYPLQIPPGSFSLTYFSGGSGSCPFLFTWDGSDYRFEADEFAAGKLGLQTSKGYRRPNPLDYHVLANEPAVKDGELEYKLVEERAETDYLDQLKLYTVDAPADRDVYVERSQAEGVGTFTKLDAVIHTTMRNLKPPAKVTYVNTGEDVTSKIAASDGDMVMLNQDRNEGYDYQTLELDLGDVKDAPRTKLVIDGRTCIPVTVAGRQRSLQFTGQVKFQVQDSAGNWVSVPTTNTILPKPPEFTRPFVLDLSRIWISDSRKVRFTFLYKTYFDSILLDTSTDVPVKITEVPLASAELASHGFDGKSSLGELYDYVYGEPVRPPDYTLPGNYTKFGDVTPLLRGIDDKFVIFGGGDELTLRFNPPSASAENVNRRYLFLSDGYYKDLKQDIAHTVEPLPFAAMSNFPYPANESYPTDADHQAYLAEWNTRYEDGVSTASASTTSLLDRIGDLFAKVVKSVESLFAPEPAGTNVAAAPLDAPVFSIDTDKLTLNVNYSASTTAVNAVQAWQSASTESVKPTPGSPGTDVSGNLTSILSDNGVYWRTELSPPDSSYNWQLVRFNVSDATLNGARSVMLDWNGHGEPSANYPVKLYLWDFQASQWVLGDQGQGSTDFSLPYVVRQAGNEKFCLTCHSASPPAGAQGVAGLVDINAWWSSDFHGDGSGGGSSGSLLAPYARGNSSVECSVCHDSHGSSNLYHLKSTINGRSGIVVTNGNQYQNACAACHAGGAIDWHGGCNDCHLNEHGWGPTMDDTADCASCHKHGTYFEHYTGSCHGCGAPNGRTF